MVGSRELLSYINSLKKEGISEELIKEKLISSNYPKQFVDSFFLRIKLMNFLKLFIPIFFFIIISIFGFLYFESQKQELEIFGLTYGLIKPENLESLDISHGNNKLKFTFIDFFSDYELYNEIIADSKTGVSNYDLVLFPPTMIGEMVERDYLLDLTPFIPQESISDLIPIIRYSNIGYNNLTYAIPFRSTFSILYYRKDLFEDETNKKEFLTEFGYELAPPENWDQYADIAKFMTRDIDSDGDIDIYGSGEGYGKALAHSFVTRFIDYGGEFFYEDMKPAINSEIGIKSLKNLRESLLYSGTVKDTGHNDADLYGMGKTAMIFINDFMPFVLNNPEIHTKTGYVSFPNKTIVSGLVMGIPKKSENTEASLAVLNKIIAKETDFLLLKKISITEFREEHLIQNLKILPEESEYIFVLNESYMNSYPSLSIPGTGEYMSSLDETFNEFISNDKMSEKEILDIASKKWEEITESKGRVKQYEAYQAYKNSIKRFY